MSENKNKATIFVLIFVIVSVISLASKSDQQLFIFNNYTNVSFINATNVTNYYNVTEGNVSRLDVDQLYINGSNVGIRFNNSIDTGFRVFMSYLTEPTGIPTADGFKMVWIPNFIGAFNDYLVFVKADGNDVYSDGGFAFVSQNTTNHNKTLLRIDGNGDVTINNTFYADYVNVSQDVIANDDIKVKDDIQVEGSLYLEADKCNAGEVLTSDSVTGEVGCIADATGGGGSVNGTSISVTSLTASNITYGNTVLKWRLNDPDTESNFDDMNLLITAYNRLTTAPTINSLDNITSAINFPSAASIDGDGGLVIAGSTATNLQIINVSKLNMFDIMMRRSVTATNRKDVIGVFYTGSSLVMNSTTTQNLIGVFFYLNTTTVTTKTWEAKACSATTTCTTINTGVTADEKMHRFTIVGNNRFDDTKANNSGYYFYIDNSLKAIINSTIPTQKVSTVGTWVQSNDATADTGVVDWVYYEMMRTNNVQNR